MVSLKLLFLKSMLIKFHIFIYMCIYLFVYFHSGISLAPWIHNEELISQPLLLFFIYFFYSLITCYFTGSTWCCCTSMFQNRPCTSWAESACRCTVLFWRSFLGTCQGSVSWCRYQSPSNYMCSIQDCRHSFAGKVYKLLITCVSCSYNCQLHLKCNCEFVKMILTTLHATNYMSFFPLREVFGGVLYPWQGGGFGGYGCARLWLGWWFSYRAFML